MGDETNNCYLCGAPNEPDASHCVRCSGQLLRLPSPEPDPPSKPALAPGTDLGLDELRGELDEAPESKKSRPAQQRRLRRKGSIEDDRLSDALGLHGDSDSSEADITEAANPVIPRAKPLSEMPILGSQPVAPSKHKGNEEPGKRILVLLGLLFLATAWLGYTTLQTPPAPPESVALADADLSPDPPTNTEPPIRAWTQTEIDSRYEDTFVYVELATCSRPDPTTGDSEILNSVESHGVAINDAIVVADLNPLPSATAAQVTTRLGQRRFAIVGASDNGERVVLSPTPTRDQLLGEAPDGASLFQLTFDPATNTVTTAELLATSDLGDQATIVATDQGGVSLLGIGGREITFEELTALSGAVIVEGEAAAQGDICDWAQVMRSAAEVPITEPADLDDTPDVDEEVASENSQETQQ